MSPQLDYNDLVASVKGGLADAGSAPLQRRRKLEERVEVHGP